MGGGDLNSKKSWHPNNLKNQERVWKAEQAAAEEQKRIMELQKERVEERDRAELNELAKRNTVGSANDSRLHWMYDKPDKSVQHEDYLLGKAIEKNDPLNKSEAESIPVVARRVVGSSMLATSGDTQVDLARKIREDPLLLVKERERAARAALLNNPLQRRKLTELLRKEQEKKKEMKSLKKTKKNKSDLDDALVAKLNSLGKEKNIDLAALLASSDSSSDSSPERKPKKAKKKKKKEGKEKKKSKKSKKKKKARDSDTDSNYEHRLEANTSSNPASKKREYSETSKRHGNTGKDISDSDDKHKKRRKHDHSIDKDKFDIESMSECFRDSDDRKNKSKIRQKSPERHLKREEVGDKRDRSKRGGLSEEERQARLAEMVAAGAIREMERGRRVAQQRAAPSLEPAQPRRSQPERALPDSLEARIHSNRHYIQRDRRHMDEPFARR